VLFDLNILLLARDCFVETSDTTRDSALCSLSQSMAMQWRCVSDFVVPRCCIALVRVDFEFVGKGHSSAFYLIFFNLPKDSSVRMRALDCRQCAPFTRSPLREYYCKQDDDNDDDDGDVDVNDER
jgi:hypothetical protein